MTVLKYQGPRNRYSKEIPEPIFFEPNNDGRWKPVDGGYLIGGLWRSDPHTDSWHLKNNPDKKNYKKGMPLASKYNCYNADRVTEASDQEIIYYMNLKAQYGKPEYEFTSPL